MNNIVGIDLGTTFSAVGRLDETGRPIIVHNTDGENITPSVVTIEAENTVTVGIEAQRMLDQDENTFGRFKRTMGTDELYTSKYGSYSSSDLSGFVLKKLKTESESAYGNIAEAVITIPANFANEAREATMQAATNAGLTVKYIINEPTAAALYYAQFSGNELGGYYAIYDLGGGTFDITIVEASGNDIKVLSTDGVNKLGGDDFDRKLQEIVARKYTEQTGHTFEGAEYFRNDAEEDKKSLSRREKITARVSGPNGRANIVVTRSEFEEAISSLIAQTEMLCESALADAGITARDLNQVILAGGSTRMPVVKNSVEKAFGKLPITFGNPDEVVALGAAVYAAYKTDKSNLNAIQRSAVEKISISEITSQYYGTISVAFNEAQQKENLKNSILIQKGSNIPCSIKESFYTVVDNQTAVNCQVTESHSPEDDPRFVKVIWEGDLELPGGRPKGQEIEISFSYDENQIMKCSFTDVETGKRRDVDLSIGGDQGADDIDIEMFIVD